MPDKIVLEHNGAIGDFLLTWPAALALARAFPRAALFFNGKSAHARWLAPLGYAPCPPGLRRELDALYGRERWPQSLDGVMVVRPGLAKRPDIPASAHFHFLRGVVPGRYDPPARLYQEGLAAMGIAWPRDWPRRFRELFAAPRRDYAGNGPVLCFPGAGHPFKMWPLERFLQLADRLRDAGFDPVLVLGPAESGERFSGLRHPVLRPESLAALEGLLLGAKAVIGNDSGPMHLAGMLGIPGLALFGPTSPSQWGPAGLTILRGSCPRSPCAQITAGAFPGGCPAPACLDSISLNQAAEALFPLLENAP